MSSSRNRIARARAAVLLVTGLAIVACGADQVPTRTRAGASPSAATTVPSPTSTTTSSTMLTLTSTTAPEPSTGSGAVARVSPQSAGGASEVPVAGSEAPPAPSEPVAVEGPCTGYVGDLLAQFFADDLAWAQRTVWRESHCNPDAQNPSSTAAGLFQMLDIHAWRFTEVGCSWSMRYDAWCNVAAARNLYDDAGRRPWGG